MFGAAFLHVTFQHLLANMLLFAVLGGLLERHYGSVRVLLVLVLSTSGAAFFAGAFEAECTLVSASSCSRRSSAGMAPIVLGIRIWPAGGSQTCAMSCGP